MSFCCDGVNTAGALGRKWFGFEGNHATEIDRCSDRRLPPLGVLKEKAGSYGFAETDLTEVCGEEMVSANSSFVNADQYGTVEICINCQRKIFLSEEMVVCWAAMCAGGSRFKHLLLLLIYKTKRKTIPAHPGVELRFKRLHAVLEGQRKYHPYFSLLDRTS